MTKPLRNPPHKLVVLLAPGVPALLGGSARARDHVRFPLASVGASLAIGCGTGLYAAAPVMDVFERYHTAADIPNHRFQDRDAFSVVVVKVADGDTLRARHVPALDFARGRWRPKSRGRRQAQALGRDFADPPRRRRAGDGQVRQRGMPMGDEATEFVKRIDGKRVRVTLQSKDQYGRAVAKISYGCSARTSPRSSSRTASRPSMPLRGRGIRPGRTEKVLEPYRGPGEDAAEGGLEGRGRRGPAAYKRKVKAGK